MREHEAQDAIRLALMRRGCLVFRVNVGEGWTGASSETLVDGTVRIIAPRRFATGLPKGFPDLLVLAPGGKCAFVEVKSDKGRLSPDQERFIERAKALGFRAGLARSAEDAITIVEGGRNYV